MCRPGFCGYGCRAKKPEKSFLLTRFGGSFFAATFVNFTVFFRPFRQLTEGGFRQFRQSFVHA